MDDHDPALYGARIAADYDHIASRQAPDTDAAVATLVGLAAGGPVLEFGIGTGRLALPLLARGLAVAGIDASDEMVERLRTKPRGDEIPVTIGDFAHTSVPGTFALVVLAINTIYALPSQDAQVDCFANAAAHLRAGGRFVVDAWVPDPAAFRREHALRTLWVEQSEVMIESAHVDTVTQRMTTTKVRLRDGDVRLFPANHRYAWPSELDLMARLAGMRLEHRWAGWEQAPFDATSERHVSVYRRS